MKYLVTEMRAITVEAASEEEASELGASLLDGGFGETYAVECELLTRETRE